MIGFEEYASLDGIGLAQLIGRGEVSAQEVVDTAIAAIEKMNPHVNAVLQFLPDAATATAQAGLPSGPFRGVPLLIKEIVLSAKGVRCESGSALAEGYVPKADTELMARFRGAGLVLCGTTRTPEFGYSPTTEPRFHGAVRNPWKAGHSPGGSSGGAGAAVAAGIVPIAHASDGGGSIRIPASCNGLVGLKPSRDLIPTGPDYGDLLYGLAAEFALTRTVRDTAALLDAVGGADIGAPGMPLPAPESYATAITRPPKPLRIAWTTQAGSGEQSASECQAAVHDTVQTLQELGHTLIEGAPRYDWEAFLKSTHLLQVSCLASGVASIAAELGRVPSPDNLEAVTFAMYEEGKRYTAIELTTALGQQNTVSRQVGAFFESVDMLLTPTMKLPPCRLGEFDQNSAVTSPWEWSQKIFSYVPFPAVFNTTGQPAISLPMHWSSAGLPIGVQLAGRFGDDATLLQLAAQLEQARPWKQRRPPIHVACL